MDTLSMTRTKRERWCGLMLDVRRAHGARFPDAPRAKFGPRDLVPLDWLAPYMKRTDGDLYTVVRLGRVFRGALQVDANGAGKDVTAAIRLIERAEEDGRITASQRAELFEIMGVAS